MESAAGAEKRTNGPLIAADEKDGDKACGPVHIGRGRYSAVLGLAPSGPASHLHGSLPPPQCSITFFHREARLACSSVPGASRAFGLALTTRSTAGSPLWCNRNDSRMIRRMRFRSTAFPAVRTATAMPRRAPLLSLLLAVTAKNPLPKRRPRAYAASNSALRRRRLCAGKVSRCIFSPRPTDSTSDVAPRSVPWRQSRVPVRLQLSAGGPHKGPHSLCGRLPERGHIECPRRRASARPEVPGPEAGACADRLGDQLPPAFGAAPSEHSPTVLGRHARPEPMRTLAAQLARLIGTLHTGSSRGSMGSKKGRQG